jgi:hypothetical protein
MDCQCKALQNWLTRYLSSQTNNVEALLSARRFLQSESGQNEILLTRLDSYIRSSLNLSDDLLGEISSFQSVHMSLWLAGILELKAAASTKNSNLPTPNWFAYDEAFMTFLARFFDDEKYIRTIISEVNTAKTRIWISIQEPAIDPAFLLLAAGNFEFELKRLRHATETIETGAKLANIRDAELSELPQQTFFKGVEKTKFLEGLAFLETALGVRDEFLRTRANLALQIRHVYSHGNGHLDSKAISRLTQPFEDALHSGMKIPLGDTQHDFGADFFLDIFGALTSTLYLALSGRMPHIEDCPRNGDLGVLRELPELVDALPKTYKVLIEGKA